MKRQKALLPLLTLCFLVFAPAQSLAQLSGIKYIGGTSPDYATIEDAVCDLNSQGVGTGGVTFLIRSGNYAESDNLIILDLNSSAANPVVFQPDSDAEVVIGVTISGDFSCAFKIHNSDHIKFNGTPYGSTDGSRHMAINSIRNNDDDVFVFWIANGADHITLENMTISSVSYASPNDGWSTPIYCSTYEVPSPLLGMDSFALLNCEIIGGSTYGVFLDGGDLELTNFQFVNNVIHDWQKIGMRLTSNVIDCNIEGNEIFQTFDEARSSVYGMSIMSSNTGIMIHHNYIHDLKHSELSGPKGIQLYGGSSNNLVYNNIFHLVPGSTANTSYCFYMSSGDGTNNHIYYNTMYLGGIDTRGTDSYCMKVSKEATDHIFNNNILINERTGPDAGDNEHGALYINAASTFAESDHNFLTVNSDAVGDNRYVARIGSGTSATFYNTLAELQSAPGYAPRDQNSLSGDPDLCFPDLHLEGSSDCIGAATPIVGITTDYDYDLRDELNPDIGADEFGELSPPQSVTSHFDGINVVLSWDPVPGATYKLYESTYAYGAFPTGWTEIWSGSDTSYSFTPGTGEEKFYCVTAND